jgi:hypothetical protein
LVVLVAFDKKYPDTRIISSAENAILNQTAIVDHAICALKRLFTIMRFTSEVSSMLTTKTMA